MTLLVPSSRRPQKVVEIGVIGERASLVRFSGRPRCQGLREAENVRFLDVNEGAEFALFLVFCVQLFRNIN